MTQTDESKVEGPVDFAYVESAQHPDQYDGTGMDGYGNGATWAAKCILGAARRDPIAFKAAMDKYRENPYGNDIDELLLPDEHEVLDRYGMTGFQWGWAVGTVARLTEQAPVPNGALITMRTGS